MTAITASSLLTLEAYARQRQEIRSRVLAHKKRRTLHLGGHVTLLFEDETTIRYQVQEMLRIEKTFEAAGIQDELDAYNPLIPEGSNLKATMMIEYEDPAERARELERLLGIEHRVYVQVEGTARCYAVADEDMPRANDSKTSAVHFLRFEIAARARALLSAGAPLVAGIDHPLYHHSLDLPAATRAALLADLAP